MIHFLVPSYLYTRCAFLSTRVTAAIPLPHYYYYYYYYFHMLLRLLQHRSAMTV